MDIETRLRIIQRHIENSVASYETKQALEQIVEVLRELAKC